MSWINIHKCNCGGTGCGNSTFENLADPLPMKTYLVPCLLRVEVASYETAIHALERARYDPRGDEYKPNLKPEDIGISLVRVTEYLPGSSDVKLTHHQLHRQCPICIDDIEVPGAVLGGPGK